MMSVKNEQTDAERDGRTCLTRANSQTRPETGKRFFSSSADHGQDWQTYPVDPYCAECDDHIYIQEGRKE